jgi:hypothetical protein
MKRVFLILAVALGFAVCMGGSVWAGVIPGDFWDGPGSGDGGSDDDHPWGGDRIIGGGDSDEKYTAVSVITGYYVLDAVIGRIVLLVNSETVSTDVKTAVVTPAVTETTSARPASYRPSYRSSAKGVSYR